MENASKALLMAGGVLLTMLVVSLGVYFANTLSEYVSGRYQKMEEQKITEFNQQFLNYNNTEVNIQDIVTLINLAKDSNDKNSLSEEMPPSDPKNDGSYYITININISSGNQFKKVLDEWNANNGTTYSISNAEKFPDEMINEIITNEMINGNNKYKCKVYVNNITKYINEVEITL